MSKTKLAIIDHFVLKAVVLVNWLSEKNDRLFVPPLADRWLA